MLTRQMADAVRNLMAYSGATASWMRSRVSSAWRHRYTWARTSTLPPAINTTAVWRFWLQEPTIEFDLRRHSCHYAASMQRSNEGFRCQMRAWQGVNGRLIEQESRLVGVSSGRHSHSTLQALRHCVSLDVCSKRLRGCQLSWVRQPLPAAPDQIVLRACTAD